MLAVISDDFTGASEIAGIALAQGYRTVIETRTVRRVDADVIVIATDMRSLEQESAARKSAQLTAEILALEPELIFKKVDSVMRGNIGPELEAQMQVEGKSTALLVPANPTRQRTIADGIYYVDGKPVGESGFAINHDFASPTSRAVDILRNRGASNAICISPGEPFRLHGIHIGNTKGVDDLRKWAESVTDQLVPAGAADFFQALLEARSSDGRTDTPNGSTMGKGRALFACGSNFPSSRDAVASAQSRGAKVIAMPDEIYFNDHLERELLNSWADDIIAALTETDTVIITAFQSPNGKSICGHEITGAVADVVRQVVEENAIDDLLIEGGATSQAVMSALGVDCLFPSQSLAPGVTSMHVDSYPDLHVTMKPGSYRWPDKIWGFD